MVPSDDTIEETAREFADRFGDGAFVSAAALLTENGRERIVESYPDEFREGSLKAEDALEQYWWGLYGQYGDFEGVVDVAIEDGAAAVELDYADGSEVTSVDVEGGGVAALSFSPAYEVPDYVNRDAFSERNVTIDAGNVELDGVLAVPIGNGPFPGAVLVHGHGIHDLDGTAGATKILKDLAWGLASEGIASLRYEKRLHNHEVATEDYTLDTIVTDDALAAVSTLADTEEVDAGSVFVVGHSQGGMCAPRIADRHGGVTGVMALDPPSDPIVDPDDLVFMRYSMELDGDLSEEQREEVEAQRETFRRIAEGEFDADDTIMGRPGVWHRSHRDYDPMTTASDLDVPVFVLKTGRADEEIQRELYESLREGFEEWQAADLPDDSRTEFYENVGHWVQDGPAPVTPSRLYFGGNVAEYVLADMAYWIHGVTDA